MHCEFLLLSTPASSNNTRPVVLSTFVHATTVLLHGRNSVRPRRISPPSNNIQSNSHTAPSISTCSVPWLSQDACPVMSYQANEHERPICSHCMSLRSLGASRSFKMGISSVLARLHHIFISLTEESYQDTDPRGLLLSVSTLAR
jgi:hypothetical protein